MTTNTTTSDKKIPTFIDGIAAALGSTIAISILQPFDMIKVRLQGSGFGASSSSSRGSVVSTFKDIVKHEGYRQFWRGVTPTILASGVAWGAYMHFYESYKNLLKSNQGGLEMLPLSQNFICGVAAGASQVFITNPIFLIKTRMQLQKPGSESYYTGFLDGIKKTIQNEGFAGLYKGVVPALWLTLHGGVQILSLSATEIFIASTTSKFLASTILYPFQVMKTRLQDERNIPTKNKAMTYIGTWDVVKKIYRNEGIYGFYRGVIPNTLKVLPNSSITLLAYEEIKSMIQKYY
eukprot:gene2611-3236_t